MIWRNPPYQCGLFALVVSLLLLPAAVGQAAEDEADQKTRVYRLKPLLDAVMATHEADPMQGQRGEPLTRAVAREQLITLMARAGDVRQREEHEEVLTITASAADHRRMAYLLEGLGGADPDTEPAEASESVAEWDTLLRRRINVQWRQVPLEQVLEELFDELEVPVRADWHSLLGLGIEPTTPISVAGVDREVGTVLLHLVETLRGKVPIRSRIDYALGDGAVRIWGDAPKTVRVYDVRDLIADSDGEPRAERVGRLLDSLRKTVRAGGWMQHGGLEAIVQEFNGRLAVFAGSSVQWQVAGVLDRLQAAEGEPEPWRLDFLHPDGWRDDLLEQRFDVDWQQTPVEDAVRQLAETIRCPIRVDWEHLDRQKPVTLTLRQTPLAVVLQDLIQQVSPEERPLDFRFAPSSIEIGARNVLPTLPRVYTVADPAAEGGEGADRIDRLMEKIRTTIAPETWQRHGPSTMFSRNGQLVVRAPGSVVWQIEQRLMPPTQPAR